MDLSIRLIAEELPELFFGRSIHSHFTQDLIEYSMLFDMDSMRKEKVLYVSKAKQVNEAYKNKVLFGAGNLKEERFSCACLGKPADEVLADKRCDIIYTESDMSLFAYFNAIHEVFSKYLAWESELIRIVMDRGSLRDLVKASLGIIQNDIWITDQYAKVILYKVYQNVRYTAEQIAEVKENEYLPRRMLIDGHDEEMQGRNFSSPGAYYHHMQAHNSMTLYNIVYTRGNYRLDVSIEENYRDLTEGDYVKSLILGKYVQILYSNAEVIASSEFEFGDWSLIKDSLSGKVVDLTLLSRALAVLGWDVGRDHLACCTLCYHKAMLEKTRRDLEPELAIMGLLRSFCACRTFIFESNVFALINLDKSGMSPQELIARLPEEIMSADMACGISDLFFSLDELRGRYRQAVVTLEVAKEEKSDKGTVLCYSDAMLDITIDCIAQAMPPTYYAPQQLIDLIKRDHHYNSSLYETLKTYLYSNCSIAEVCRKLFLQRNGALYRLEKAKELLPSFDLRSPEDRLKLMISMEIISEKSLPTNSPESQ